MSTLTIEQLLDQYRSGWSLAQSFYTDAQVFEQEWELVPGRWSFEISRDGNKLAERSFTVYKP